MSHAWVASRLRQLENRTAIDELIAEYGFVIDNRDTPALAELFCEQAELRSRDWVVNTLGRVAIFAWYQQRLAAPGPTFHYTHDRVLNLGDANPDVANVILCAYAEVVRHQPALLAAIRYHDQ
jgi:hypothetical protein